MNDSPCPGCTHTECACDCSTCEQAARTPRRPCPCYTCAKHRRVVGAGTCPVCRYPIESASPRYEGSPSAPRVKLDLSDPAIRAVWDACVAARAEVAAWPSWKLGRCNCPRRESES